MDRGPVPASVEVTPSSPPPALSAVRLVVRGDHRCWHPASGLDRHPLVTRPRPYQVSLAGRRSVGPHGSAGCGRLAGRCPLRRRPGRRSLRPCGLLRWSVLRRRLLGGTLAFGSLRRRLSCRSSCARRHSALKGNGGNAYACGVLTCRVVVGCRCGDCVVHCPGGPSRIAPAARTAGLTSTNRYRSGRFHGALFRPQILLVGECQLDDRERLLQRVVTRVDGYLHFRLLNFACTWTDVAAARVEPRPTTRIGEH